MKSAGAGVRPGALALLPTLLVSWGVFTQIVSFRGLVIWLVLGSMICLFVINSFLRAGRKLVAIGTAAVLPIVLAFVADTVGGNTSGPLARSTLIFCGLVSVATVFTYTREPRWALVPMLGLFVCGLALGATGSVVPAVGVWVVAAGASLLVLGPYRRKDLSDRERFRPIVLVFLGSGIISLLGAWAFSFILGKPWVIPASNTVALPINNGSGDPGGSPILIDGESISSPIGAGPGVETTAPMQVIAAQAGVDSVVVVIVVLLLSIMIALLIVGLFWLIGAVMRRLWVWLGWRWVRHKLRTGTARARVLGAWEWTRLRFARSNQPLPVYLSPDTAVVWATKVGDPSLADLAAVVAPVAFDTNLVVQMPRSAQAWDRSNLVDRQHRRTTLRDRWVRSARSVRKVKLGLEAQSPVAQTRN